ncbi:MAG: hypothetical protein EAX95_14140 [Candidatus Thorarchaeota archaeon]|nr:hypothetical protein [Candidatus Thorarchaeota archaeon]
MHASSRAKHLLCCLVVFLIASQVGVVTKGQVYSPSIDFLIITHEDFLEECLRLSEWKNSTEMRSSVVTWQDLVSEFPGADAPERIKRGIAHWYSVHGVKYVLLMGDADMFPVRYIAMDWNAHTPEPDKLSASDFVYSVSDLYYADLFNSSEDFDDWDYDKNRMYGELWGAWKMAGLGPINYDRLDMIPDVAVGRVPASTVQEARNYVDKVISYETHASLQTDWFVHSLLIANGVNDLGQYDLSDEIDAKLTPFGFSTREFYDVDLSNPPRPYSERPDCTRINYELNMGTGYVNFAGHGNPSWLPEYGITANDFSVWFGLNVGLQFNVSERAKAAFCSGRTGQPAVGDFDGDGDSDIIFFQDNGTARYAFTNTYDGYTYVAPMEYQTDLSPFFLPSPDYPKVGDFNGDGRTDLVQLNKTSGEIYVTLATIGGGTFGTPSVWGSSFCVGTYPWVVGDFDGDSRDDVLYRHGPAFYAAISTGTGFNPKVEMLNAVLPSSYIVPGDYDGDSVEDLALIDYSSGNINYLKSTGQVFLINSSYSYSGLCPGDLEYGAEVFSADLYDDGFDDLVLFLRDSRIGGSRTVGDEKEWERMDVCALNSDGDGWYSFGVWHDSFCSNYQIPGVGDFDEDGRDDIVLFNRHIGGDPFDGLNNKDCYPVLFAASCSTAQFAIIPPWSDYLATSGVNQTGCNDGNLFPLVMFHGVEIRLAPTPDPLQPFDSGCMAERFLVQYDEKGAVAYFGGVEVLQDYVNDFNRYFIYDYVSGENILGNMWNYALTTYITDRSIGQGEHSWYADDWGDVAEYQQPSKIALFGDPSLRVFETPEPTTTPVTTIPPEYIIVIGGGIAAGVGIAIIIRKIRFRPRP